MGAFRRIPGAPRTASHSRPALLQGDRFSHNCFKTRDNTRVRHVRDMESVIHPKSLLRVLPRDNRE